MTFDCRVATTVEGEVARFSATGLADTDRPKVKAARKKEAARVNNIIAGTEKFVGRRASEDVVSKNRD